MPRVNKYGLTEYPTNVTWNNRNSAPNLGNYQSSNPEGHVAGASGDYVPSSTNWLPLAIGAAVNVGQTIWSSAQQRAENRRERQARREEADKAHARDIEMWERQNEYNHPRNQQERFREAGLNPHLMYGQGDPGNASQMPSYNPAQLDYGAPPLANVTAGIESYLDLTQQQSQINHTQKQTDVAHSQNALTMARTNDIWNDQIIKGVEVEIARAILNSEKGTIENIAKGRINGMLADDWLKEATAQIRQWEAKLTENNINPRDSVQMRYLIDFLEAIGFSPKKIRNYLEGRFNDN